MSRFSPLPQPLSVWIVNPFDDIPGEGLPPLRYWSLARVLAGRGHDVTWWSSTWSHRRKAVRTVPMQMREDEGFSVRLVAVRPYAKNVSLARFASHRDFGRTFERLANESVAAGQLARPDVILASLPPLDSPEAAARLAKRLDALLVVDLMDVWPETFQRLLPGPRWFRQMISPLLLGGMYRRRAAVIEAADAISTATQTYADTMLRNAAGQKLTHQKPMHLCYLGAYLQEFSPPVRVSPVAADATATPTDATTQPVEKPAAITPLPEKSLPDKPLACVYSGTLEAGQDVLTAIAAAKMLSAAGTPAEIHIAGTGKFEASIRAAAAGISGSCRVIIHGLLDRTAYVRLLSACDVGLVLVKPESLVTVPYKACDYAAAGLAIINSLPGELESLVTSSVAGLKYTAGDAASLARAIASLASNRPLLLNYRQGARRLAEAEFDREKTYSQFAQWIEATAS